MIGTVVWAQPGSFFHLKNWPSCENSKCLWFSRLPMILPTSSECEDKSSLLRKMTSNEEDTSVTESTLEATESLEEREVAKHSKKVLARRKPEKSRIVRVWQSKYCNFFFRFSKQRFAKKKIWDGNFPQKMKTFSF